MQLLESSPGHRRSTNGMAGDAGWTGLQQHRVASAQSVHPSERESHSCHNGGLWR